MVKRLFLTCVLALLSVVVFAVPAFAEPSRVELTVVNNTGFALLQNGYGSFQSTGPIPHGASLEQIFASMPKFQTGPRDLRVGETGVIKVYRNDGGLKIRLHYESTHARGFGWLNFLPAEVSISGLVGDTLEETTLLTSYASGIRSEIDVQSATRNTLIATVRLSNEL